MNNTKVNLVEAFVGGLIVGLFVPSYFGGIDGWRFWAFIILGNALFQTSLIIFKHLYKKAKEKS